MAYLRLADDDLSKSIIGAFYEVYENLGYGFLEHVYASAMERELRNLGHSVGTQVSVWVRYKGEHLCQYRLDMLVNSEVILELKSSEVLAPNAQRQLRNYLRCTDLEVGILLHFGPKPEFYRKVITNDLKSL